MMTPPTSKASCPWDLAFSVSMSLSMWLPAASAVLSIAYMLVWDCGVIGVLEEVSPLVFLAADLSLMPQTLHWLNAPS